MSRGELTRDLTRYAGYHRRYPEGWRHEVRSHRPRGSTTVPFMAAAAVLLAWAGILLTLLLHPW